MLQMKPLHERQSLAGNENDANATASPGTLKTRLSKRDQELKGTGAFFRAVAAFSHQKVPTDLKARAHMVGKVAQF